MNPRRPLAEIEPRTVLVVLPTWVGDFVMATPLLHKLRDRFADARMTWLMEPNLRDLVTGCPWPDDRIEWPPRPDRGPFRGPMRRLVADLRKRRVDLAVLLPNAFRAAWLTRAARATRRVGYDRDGRGLLLTDRIRVPNLRKHWTGTERDTADGWRPSAAALRVPPALPHRPGRYVPMRLTDYYAGLARALGCEHPGDRFRLHRTPEDDRTVEQRLSSLGIDGDAPVVVLSPGAKYGAAKCWPPDRFAAAADALVEQAGAKVIVTCGPGEEAIARRIGDGMKHRAFVFDDPRMSLGELKSLIARCDLLICNDAGPRHFAKAFDRPLVTIFGPTHQEWTATDYPREIVASVEVDCGPCQQRTCPLGHVECMTGVHVNQVVEAATSLLGSGKADASSR